MDWVIAWQIAFKATHFVSPHCAEELEEYSDHITSYFASITDLDFHFKSINLGSHPKEGWVC